MKLYTPGPVPVPQRVMHAACQPIIHHHSEQFRLVLERTRTNLGKILHTEQTVVLMSGCAMTAIESVTAACVRPGERVLVLRHGRFGDRLADCCAVYGAEVVSCSAPWGDSISPDMFRTALQKEMAAGPLRAVWLVHSETSTGVSLDLQQIASILQELSPETLLLVDGVTSVAIQELYTDSWGIDAVVFGAQKGLMSPPGVGIVALSRRFEEFARNGASGKYTNDLRRILEVHGKGLMLWTPPVSIVCALAEATSMIVDEGLESVWRRHAELHEYVTSQALQRDFTVFGEATSKALVAISHPQIRRIRELLKHRHTMLVADGQDQLSGTIMRIGICGSYSLADMRELFAAIDDVLIHIKDPS
ncbi:MAG: pyridoxal-phosphate-dependent aminotransferase family protein [Candidatus Kapaibacterium sp.]